MRALIVEADKEMGDFIAKGLRGERFLADEVRSGEEGVAFVKEGRYDAAVIDLDGPARSSVAGAGLQTIAALRGRGETFPILALSADATPAAKVKALNLGADDYLVKPFAVIELVARLRALLRRERKMTGPVLAVGDLMLDTLTHKATRAGRPLVLGRKEFVLLEYLMRNAGTPLTRGMILEHAWDMNADPFTNTVDVHISFLRAKIDKGRRKNDRMIKTVYGYGYKIEGGKT